MCIHISEVLQESASLKASIYQAPGQTTETFTALGGPRGGKKQHGLIIISVLNTKIVGMLGSREHSRRAEGCSEEQPCG